MILFKNYIIIKNIISEKSKQKSQIVLKVGTVKKSEGIINTEFNTVSL